MFMGLTTEAADGTVIPGAAESWTISDDGLTYTFTLRDHSWSDGTPVTAEDSSSACAGSSIPRPRPSTPTCSTRSRTRQPSAAAALPIPRRSACARSTPKPSRSRWSGHLLFRRAADPLHRLPDSQAQDRGAGRRLGQARQHRRQRRLHGGRVGAQHPGPHGQERHVLGSDNVAIDEVVYYPTEERNTGTSSSAPARSTSSTTSPPSRSTSSRRTCRKRPTSRPSSQPTTTCSTPRWRRSTTSGCARRWPWRSSATRSPRRCCAPARCRPTAWCRRTLAPTASRRRSTGRACLTRSGSSRPRRCSPRRASAPTIR